MSKSGWIGVSPKWLQIKKEALGISWDTFGRIVGIDGHNLRKYSTGDKNMKPDTQKKIYNAFKLYENGK